eukprot:5034466-Amphidinium_carterae.1
MRSRQAARGWLKLSPNQSRLPMPWPAVAGIIHQLKVKGHHEASLATAVCFVLMLRPSECLRIQVQDVVQPVAGMPKHMRQWA